VRNPANKQTDVDDYITSLAEVSHKGQRCLYAYMFPGKLCAWRHDMPPPLSSPVGAQVPHAAEPSRRTVPAVSHGEHVPTRTAAAALRVKAALSKAVW